MARQPQGRGICLLKRLSGSLLGMLCLFGMPAFGGEIDSDDLVVLASGARFDDDIVPAAPVALPAASSSKRMRTLAWHEGLLEMLSQQWGSANGAPDTRRSPVPTVPVPTVNDICASLERVLPYFDLAVHQLPKRLRQRLCQRVHTYAVRYRLNIQAMLYRADDYLPMIKRTLREYELPTYYAYVPLVESAFQVDAMHSGSGARGLWQLMRDTALASGLSVSKAVDERLHPRRSTEAAVAYLAYLYKRFGAYGPLYVLAAYNYGETNLSRNMRRFHPPAIASLYSSGCVPAETREYLLRMMTMWVIIAHPGRFHFLLREAADPPPPPLDAVPRRDDLVGVAEGDDTKS